MKMKDSILIEIKRKESKHVVNARSTALIAKKKNSTKINWVSITPLMNGLSEADAVQLIHDLFNRTKTELGLDSTSNLVFTNGYNNSTRIAERRIETDEEFNNRCDYLARQEIDKIESDARYARREQNRLQNQIKKAESQLAKLRANKL